MNSWTNSWAVAVLLGLIMVLTSIDLLLDLRVQRPGSGAAASGWSISCGTGLCAAVDAEGNTYWGVHREGPPPAGGFHWYRGGALNDAEPFGIAQCRETIRGYEALQADLRQRLAKFSGREQAETSGADTVDSAQQRMLARIERMDLQKRLEKLEAEQGGVVAECRRLIGVGK